MATGLTSRQGILYPLAADPANIATDMQNIAQYCDTNFIPYTQSAATTPPSTTISGSIWWCTNTSVTWYGMNYYNGSSWINIGVDPVYYGSTTPTTPYISMVWVNTNTTSPSIQVYNGTSWISILPGTNTAGLSPVSSGSGWVAGVPTDSTKVALSNYNVSGKNALINGAMEIWQRLVYPATSFSLAASTITYTADRWAAYVAGTGYTVSNVAPSLTTYTNNARVQRNLGNPSTSVPFFSQSIGTLNSYRFAGQQVTISFWARAGSNYSSLSNALTVQLISGTGSDQNVLNGGFTGATNVVNSTATLTTSWQQFSFTGTVSGAASQLGIMFFYTPVGTAGSNDYYDITGIQVEIGSSLTAFSRHSGSYQEELICCQFYFQALQNYTYGVWGSGTIIGTVGSSSTTGYVYVPFPVTMRAIPTFTLAPFSQFLVIPGSISITALSAGGPTGGTSTRGVNLVVTTTSVNAGTGILLQDAGGNTSYVFANSEI